MLRKEMGWHPDVDAAMERVVATLKSAGAEVVDAEIPTKGQWDEPEFEVLLFEFKAGLEHYLQTHDAPAKTLAQLIEFNKAHAARGDALLRAGDLREGECEGAARRSGVPECAREGASPGGPRRHRCRAEERSNVDVLIAPAMSPAWPTDLVLGDHFVGAGYGAAAVAGYPSLTVPMGDSHGLPIGVVFVGPAWSEAKLLSIGYAYEQRSKLRRAPQFAADGDAGEDGVAVVEGERDAGVDAAPATASTATQPACGFDDKSDADDAALVAARPAVMPARSIAS